VELAAAEMVMVLAGLELLELQTRAAAVAVVLVETAQVALAAPVLLS
jgi:hypothetical protein